MARKRSLDGTELEDLPRKRTCEWVEDTTNSTVPQEPTVPSSPLTIYSSDMSSSQISRAQSTQSAPSSKITPSQPLYRSVIARNNITLDPTGRTKSLGIETFLRNHILKERRSPSLQPVEITRVVDKAAAVLHDGETRVSALVGSHAFPVERSGIQEGSNKLWTSQPLPVNPVYNQALSIPKPDRSYGYPTTHSIPLKWSDEEAKVIDHRVARPFTQPTSENVLPFFMFEIKAESTGGVLFAAENQAVGSLVHSVESMRWLLSEADPSQDLKETDALAFAIAMSPRLAVFYLCWYSDEAEKHIVSTFAHACLTDEAQIQQCNNLTKNIIEYGLGERQKKVKDALFKLKDIPAHWSQSRPLTPQASTEETRPSKVRK